MLSELSINDSAKLVEQIVAIIEEFEIVRSSQLT